MKNLLTPPRKRTLAVLAALFLIGAIIVLIAPEENTLGSGIKSVYVHVAFIWSGSLGLLAAGIMGGWVLAVGSQTHFSWNRVIASVALALFAVGALLSIVAARINWGDVFWEEPRNRAVLQVLALGVIIQILNGWMSHPRLGGLLYTGLAAFFVYSMATTTLVLHPQSPILSSTARSIQLSFFSLLLICSSGGAVIVWHICRHEMPASYDLTPLSPKIPLTSADV